MSYHNSPLRVTEDENQVSVFTPELEAIIHKRGYVTGVAGGSFLDRRTGFRDVGFGLDIVDWIMEPGSDEEYRAGLSGDLVYDFNNLHHGRRPKRLVEGPQICTEGGAVDVEVIRGEDFAAVKSRFRYQFAAPGRNTGSEWEQTLVFPAGKRYFISSDRITCANGGKDLFLRLDMPGHIKHNQGDTFSEIYLSYAGRLPSGEFLQDFPPDGKFNYRRDTSAIPSTFIRAYRLRDPATGSGGPWLAGMTLEPSVVHEAWCHQRGYVCMIEEFGLPPGHPPLQSGDVFSAAFIVGFFDSVEEMEQVYHAHQGYTNLHAGPDGWRLAVMG